MLGCVSLKERKKCAIFTLRPPAPESIASLDQKPTMH